MDGALPAGSEDTWQGASREDTPPSITQRGLTALWLCFSLSLTLTLLRQQDLCSVLKGDSEQGTALRCGHGIWDWLYLAVRPEWDDVQLHFPGNRAERRLELTGS